MGTFVLTIAVGLLSVSCFITGSTLTAVLGAVLTALVLVMYPERLAVSAVNKAVLITGND
jgi:hypothetical protein